MRERLLLAHHPCYPGRVARAWSVLGSTLAGALCLGSTASARADVSSWLTLAGGLGQELEQGRSPRALLHLATGMGSSPADAWSFGGLFRVQTHLQEGTTLALLGRGASHGFVNGGWGVALDLGPALRTYWQGGWGLAAAASVGAPWGVVAELGYGRYHAQEQALSVVLGVDLARLTIYRTTGGSWWPNPFPAVREASSPREP